MFGLIQTAFSNFRFRSLFFRILFLLVVLVTLTAAVVGYLGNRYSQNVVREEVKNSSFQMLEQTRRLMDGLLKDVDAITIRLAQSRAFTHAMEAGAEGPTESDVSEIRNYLLEAYTSSPYIQSIYVYYGGSKLVQSPLIGPTKINETDDPEWLPYYSQMTRTEGKWFIRQYPRNDPNRIESQTQVTLIRTTPWAGTPVKGAIIVNMNQQVLFQNPSFRLMRPGEEIWMVSPDGMLAFNSNTGMEVSDQEFAVVRSRLGTDISAFTGLFRGSEFSFTAVTSPSSGWKYVNLIPITSLYKSGKDIQNFMLLLVSFAVLVAFIFAFIISLRIYSPIYSLIQLVSNKRGSWRGALSDHNQSELSILFSAFKSLEEYGSAMESQLKENWPVLQQSFLRELIQEKTKQHEERIAKFAYYSLPVTQYGFLCCVLRIDDYSAYLQKYGRYDQSLVRYFIAKLSEEIAGQAIRVYPLHTESRDIILVCNPAEDVPHESFREISLQTAERIGTSIRMYLNLTVSIGIGDVKALAGYISESYQEAITALEHRAFKGHGLVAPMWHFRDKKTPDLLLFRRIGELKRDILLQIREEHAESLEEDLQKLVEAAGSTNGLPFPLIQHAYFQLIVDVCQRSSELGLPAQDEELADMQHRLLRLETVEEVVHAVQDYIRMLSRRFVSEKSGETASVTRQILEYIRVNFNKDISLNGIADKLQLDPSYVSRLFRQEVSINFIDYLISLRLEKAKELLLTPLPIKDIGPSVGYVNQRSFNRIFKKYEGVTPGEYRNIHSSTKLNPDEIY